MRNFLVLFALGLCLLVFAVTSVSSEMPPKPSGFPSFSDLPTVAPDVNERTWQRWWIGNRAPLLVEFKPEIGKMPAERTPRKSGYVKTDPFDETAVGAEKVNVAQLLVLLGYGGPFKEVTREMVMHELRYRGDVALDEVIEIATGAKDMPPVAGMSSRQLRNYAVLALGEIDNPKVFEPLVEILQKGEQETRFFAAMALGRTGNPDAVKALLENAVEANQFIRPAVCLSLGMSGSFAGIEYIQETYKTSGANEGRLFAALSLGLLGSVDVKKQMLEAAERTDSPFVKALALYGWLSRCDPRSTEPAQLVGKLKDEDPFVQQVVLLSLGLLEYRSRLDDIVKIAQTTDDPIVRKAACLVLAMSNSKPGNELLKKLTTAGGQTAKDAEFALTLMDKESRQSFLDNWIRHPEDDVRKVAPFIVARYMKEEGIGPLDRASKLIVKMDPILFSLAYGRIFDVGRPGPLDRYQNTSEDPQVRAVALFAMAVSGCDFGISKVLQLVALEGIEQTVRELALSFAAPSVVLKYFRENPQMGNPRVCIGVATALGGIKAAGVEDVLDIYLNHGNPDTRCYAYLAMARVGTEEAANRLLGRVPAEKNPFALGNLVLALGLMLKKYPQNKEIFDALEDTMKNAAHAGVRGFAAIAWGVSGHSNAFDMIGLLANNDTDPVVKAASGLGYGLSGHESAIFALKRGITVKAYTEVREYAAYGFGVLKNNDGLRDLIGVLRDTDIAVRTAASISYGSLRFPDSSANLKDTAEGDANFDVRRVASIAMILCGDPKGFEFLVNSFKGRGDSGVREMGFVELTEVHNLYLPVGYRIDDLLQDIPIAEAEGRPAPPAGP